MSTISNPAVISSAGNIYPLDFYDLSTVVCAISFRKLRSNYTGYLIEARRSSDNAATNVLPDGNGVVSLSSIVSAGGALGTWLGSDNGFVRTGYDQSSFGNNAVNGTAGQQPQFATAGVINLDNSRATCAWDRNRTLNAPDANSLDLNTTMSVLCVVNRGSDGGNNNITLFDKRQPSGNTPGYHSWIAQAANHEQAQFNGTSGLNIVSSTGGTMTAGILMCTGYSATKTSTCQYYKNSATNGSGTFTSTGSAVNAVALKIGGHTSDVTAQFLGNYSEFILYNVILTAAQFAKVQNNQKTFYGIS